MTIDTAPKRRSLVWPVLLAAAITAVLAGGAALTYVIGWGLGEDTSARNEAGHIEVERQLECSTIKREYEAWSQDLLGLAALPRFKNLDPGFVTESALEDGKAFLKEVNGYTDQASKELAVAIAEYNVEVGFLNVQVSLGDAYEEDSYTKALAARDKVDRLYVAFESTTCP